MENVPFEVYVYVGMIVGSFASLLFALVSTYAFSHPVSWFGPRNVEKRIKYLKAEIYRLNKDMKDNGFDEK